MKNKTTVVKILSSNLFLFLVCTIGYMLWRHGSAVVWNDTGLFKAAHVNAYEQSSSNYTLLETILIYINSVKVTFPDFFREVSQHGYRPVAALIHFIFSILANEKSIYPSWGQLFVVGSVIGLLAISFKALASRFIKSSLLVYLSLILFLLSTPMLSSSWILYVGIPALVPLFTALSLILYLKILDHPKNAPVYYVGLSVTIFLSTWYREYMIMVPITIIALETIRTFNVTKVSLLMIPLFLHSLFPTFLPHMIYPTLQVKPFFKLGLINDQLSAGYVRQEVSRHLLNIPSPSFMIILFLFCLSMASIILYNKVKNREFQFSSNLINIVPILLGVLGLAGVFFANDKWPYHLVLFSFLLIGWSVDRRLAIWSAIFLLPFYKVFTTQIHLAYVIMPFSILFCASLEKYREIAFSYSRLQKIAKVALSFAIIIAMLDAAANLIAVKFVMNKISCGIEAVAKNLQFKISERPSVFISNKLHADDLRLYLRGNYELFWTIGLGHDRPDRIIDSVKKLDGLLKENLQTKNIYLLDISYNYLEWQHFYFEHPFVESDLVQKVNLGEIHRTVVDYFMPDPLRYFGNRAFFAFLGPPDLEHDFYRGRSKKPLFRRVETHYDLYKVSKFIN